MLEDAGREEEGGREKEEKEHSPDSTRTRKVSSRIVAGSCIRENTS